MHDSMQYDPIQISNGPYTGCLVSIFTVRINSMSFPWLYLMYKKVSYLPTFSATFGVRYCVLKPIVRRSAGAA